MKLNAIVRRTKQPIVFLQMKIGKLVPVSRGIGTSYTMSHFTQNSKGIVHEELFMAKVTLQSLAAPFLSMNANLSAMTGSRHVKDLTVRLLA